MPRYRASPWPPICAPVPFCFLFFSLLYGPCLACTAHSISLTASLSDPRRVAELEQENARLLELAQRGGALPLDRDQDQDRDGADQDRLLSEVEQLRSQLAAAEARERELSEELSRKASQASRVKAESVEPQLSLSSRNGVAQLHKGGASLGLMVSARLLS